MFVCVRLFFESQLLFFYLFLPLFFLFSLLVSLISLSALCVCLVSVSQADDVRALLIAAMLPSSPALGGFKHQRISTPIPSLTTTATLAPGGPSVAVVSPLASSVVTTTATAITTTPITTTPHGNSTASSDNPVGAHGSDAPTSDGVVTATVGSASAMFPEMTSLLLAEEGALGSVDGGSVVFTCTVVVVDRFFLCGGVVNIADTETCTHTSKISSCCLTLLVVLSVRFCYIAS